jgi:hypothetical protein
MPWKLETVKGRSPVAIAQHHSYLGHLLSAPRLVRSPGLRFWETDIHWQCIIGADG